MKHKSKLTLLLLTIIIFLFPSICFSESKTIEHEHCGIYLGDMKNKKELDDFRKTERLSLILEVIFKYKKSYKNIDWWSDDCVSHIGQFMKIVVVSHTEKDRKICDKVRITFNTEVVDKYIESVCLNPYMNLPRSWYEDIDDVLTKKDDKINIGLIIETKIPDIDEHKKEMLENNEEQQFFNMKEWKTEKYKVIDRKNLSKILEEQKLSSSGITDSDSVKLGKILNLDVIVLRILYDKSRVTKVLKVDTGEVLLFKTYETKTEEGWIYYGKSTEDAKYYYDKIGMVTLSPDVSRVWIKMKSSRGRIDKAIRLSKEQKDEGTKKLIDEGLDKFAYSTTLQEVDCRNNTIKEIKIVAYSDEGKILHVTDTLTSGIRQVLPQTMDELLIRRICPK